MTDKNTGIGLNSGIRIKADSVMAYLFLIITCFFAFKISGGISESVTEGMRFAVFTVIPSAFPFMIVSDLYTVYGYPEKLWGISRIFTRLFGIPKCGIRALIAGNVSGFPIGAKIASELYTGGGIDKENAEKLCAYSNNPSIPFTVGAIGLGLYGNGDVGVLLLISTYLSCLMTGLIFKNNKVQKTENGRYIPGDFDLVSSIKAAGLSSLNILFFVTAFFALLGVIKTFTDNEGILILSSLFIEITSGVNTVARSHLPEAVKLSLTAFALGFGSISVMMQSSFFMKNAGLRLRSYLKIKIVQGLFSSIICLVIYSLIYILL